MDWNRFSFSKIGLLIRPVSVCKVGLMEFAGVDKAARSKNRGWKMQEWTMRHDVARVDNAGVDNAAPCGRGGQCRSGVQ